MKGRETISQQPATVELKKEIRKGGFIYRQIKRGSKSYVYAQYSLGRIVGYEVFLVKMRPERKFNGKVLPVAHRFPGNESFGSWAWSKWTLKSAMAMFNQFEDSG